MLESITLFRISVAFVAFVKEIFFFLASKYEDIFHYLWIYQKLHIFCVQKHQRFVSILSMGSLLQVAESLTEKQVKTGKMIL